MINPKSAPAGATKVRYFILFMCFVGISINYLDRANMSVALPFIDSELGLNLTNTEKGLILGAFFWAYDGMMLLAGWITDKLGARKTFSLAAVWWSVFTALTPLAYSFWTFFAVRFALGAGEAPAYPSATKAASRWFPKSERAFATAVIDSGSRVGTVLALPIVTAIIAVATWHYSFIILGAVGIIWAFFWYVTYRDPTEHERANDLERRYIIENGGRTVENDDPEAAKIKWVDLFRYRTIWGMMIGFFCLNFVIYFFLTWFPSYLKTARGLNLAELGLYGMLPGLSAVVTAWIAGALADRAIRNGANVTTVRKIIMVGGMLGGAAIPAGIVDAVALYGAVLPRDLLQQPCHCRDRHLVASRRRRAKLPPRRLDRRHPELRLQHRRHHQPAALRLPAGHVRRKLHAILHDGGRHGTGRRLLLRLHRRSRRTSSDPAAAVLMGFG